MALGYILLAAIVVSAVYMWYRAGDNSRRKEALLRLVIGVPYFAIMLVAGTVFSAYIIVVFLLDILWQFTTGNEGFKPGGVSSRLQEYRDNNIRWLINGEGSFQLLP